LGNRLTPGEKETTMTAQPNKSTTVTISKDELDRLQALAAIGKQAEEKEKATLMGKKEKATINRAKKAVIRDKARKAGLTCSVEEAKAWIAAHPPTPKK
jgi:hypothetical protein